MNLTNVEPRDLQDFSKVPPAGVWHPARIDGAEAKTSSKGNSMITLQLKLTGEGFEEYGFIFENGIITDSGAKGAGFAVKKLQGLGVDTSQEKPDEEIVSELLGKEVFVKVRHEIMKDKDASGNYTVVRYADDGKTPVKKAVPSEYSLYDPGAQKQEAAPPKKDEPTKKDEAPPAKDGKPVPPWMNKSKK